MRIGLTNQSNQTVILNTQPLLAEVRINEINHASVQEMIHSVSKIQELRDNMPSF